ncbi:MAG: hypothetical protein Q7T33_11445 [Dehalococcoidia bacterium]|nr:hypothetical protein [Dehalococcoidia bacterium]
MALVLSSGPTSAAGTINFVGLDLVTTSNTSTQINGHTAGSVVLSSDVQSCIQVQNGSAFSIDVVLDGLPANTDASRRLAGANYDVDYDGSIVKIGNDDDVDSLYDEDTQIGDGDQDADNFDGEEGNDDPNGTGATIGHNIGFILTGANDLSDGNGNDTVTYSDWTATYFKLSSFPNGPRSGVLERLQVTAVGLGSTDLTIRDFYATDNANSNPTLQDAKAVNFDIGTVGNARIEVVAGAPGACTFSGLVAAPTETPTSLHTATPAPMDALGGFDFFSAQADFSTWCSLVANPWPVPPGDDDCDGFASSREDFMTTEKTLTCGDTPGGNRDAWPPDNNRDRRAGLADVLAYIPVFNTSPPGPPYVKRLDLTADDRISLVDILAFIPFFNGSCASGKAQVHPGTTGPIQTTTLIACFQPVCVPTSVSWYITGDTWGWYTNTWFNQYFVEQGIYIYDYWHLPLPGDLGYSLGMRVTADNIPPGATPIGSSTYCPPIIYNYQDDLWDCRASYDGQIFVYPIYSSHGAVAGTGSLFGGSDTAIGFSPVP